MRFNLIAVPLFILLALPIDVNALDWKSESDIPIAKCDLPNLMMFHSWNILSKQVATGQIRAPMLNELQAIASTTKAHNKPVGEQLGVKDLSRFNELSQRIRSMGMQELVESKRDRDIKVIKQFVLIADRNYRYGEEIQEGHSDYVYQAVLLYWRVMASGFPSSEQHPISIPDEKACSMIFALHSIEKEPIQRIDSIDLKLFVKLQTIAKKNGMVKIEPAKLPEADREVYDRIMENAVWPFERAQQFMDDMENIKVMARASEIIYISDKRDLEISGGDGSRLGTTIVEMINKKEFDQRTQAAIGIWRGLNEKIPSDVTKNATDLARILKETQIKDDAKRGNK